MMCTHSRHSGFRKKNVTNLRLDQCCQPNRRVVARRNRFLCEKGRIADPNNSLFRKKSSSLNQNTNCWSSQTECIIINSLPTVRVKCKHFICLFLACFAISTRAEVPVDVSKIENQTGFPLHQLHTDTASSKRTFSDSARNQSVYIPSTESLSFTRSVLYNSDDSYDDLLNEQKSYMTKESRLTRVSRQEKLFDANRLRKSVNVRSSSMSFPDKHADSQMEYYISELFTRYNDKDFLLIENFKKMLINIGLSASVNDSYGRQLVDAAHNHVHGEHNHVHEDADHDYHDHQHTDSSRSALNNSLSSNHSKSKMKHMRSKRNSESHKRDNVQCMTAQELLRSFQFQHLERLTLDHFLHLCPALIDQLDAGYCKHNVVSEHTDKHEINTTVKDQPDHSHDDGHDHSHDHGHDHKNDAGGKIDQHVQGRASAKVWVYAIVSVIVISLCSIAGVVVIPNIKRTFYNHILQFLVALAVGTMSGDAMLHLLPHALMSESHHDNHHHHHHQHDVINKSMGENDKPLEGPMSPHLASLYKGLVALLGIYTFFFLERLFTLFTKDRSRRHKKKQKRRRPCPDADELRHQTFHMVNSNLENDAGNTPSCDDMVMVVHPNKALKAYADVSHEAFLHRCDESLVLSPSRNEVTGVLANGDQHRLKIEPLLRVTDLEGPQRNIDCATALISDAEIVGITKEKEEPIVSSHTHSHVGQDFRGSISSVAMMVVIGDMVHNFCDGLAIGAAYAGSVAGGLSTSVAVFCHELPHEIGDFAVLVRSGLSMRKAVYFNLFTSIPCFLGAVIGLTIAHMASTSLWIFAAVGGMFLYITLVDLVPEMSSVYTKCGEPWFLHLLLQASGIALGTTLMLILSIMEESLLTAF